MDIHPMIQRMSLEHNARGKERQFYLAANAGHVLREAGMTEGELAIYSQRVAEIGERLAVKVATMRNPPRLFR